MRQMEQIWRDRVAALPLDMTVNQVKDLFKVSYSTALFWLRMAGYKYRRAYVFRNGRLKKFDPAKADKTKPIPVLAKEHGVSKQYAYAEVKRWKARKAA